MRVVREMYGKIKVLKLTQSINGRAPNNVRDSNDIFKNRITFVWYIFKGFKHRRTIITLLKTIRSVTDA